jgi:hypothetical protein
MPPVRVDDVSEAEHDAVSKIEDQIEALIALVRYPKYRMEGFAWCEVDDQMTSNLIEYLEWQRLQPS